MAIVGLVKLIQQQHQEQLVLRITFLLTLLKRLNYLKIQLKQKKDKNRLEDRLKQYCKYQVLIIDELGYLPINKEDSTLFFQLVDRRYETKSTIITTNISFNNWQSIFQDSKTTAAIVDRLLHHSKIITIAGKSYRLKDILSEEQKQ